MFGGLIVAAFAFPLYGHREFVAAWLMYMVEKLNNWGDKKSNEKEGKS